ncbi:MAG TPA: YciI family protein [Kofleriaceae bacterium]|jgi:hypothetical protein
MRFMMIMYPKVSAYTAPPTLEQMRPMMKYNEELAKAGVLLGLDGLTPPAQGARLHWEGKGKPRVVDGPFTEAKEIVGGYWLIEVKSRAEAIEWASRIPGEDCFVEVRKVAGPEDFDADANEVMRHSVVAEAVGRKW